MPPSDRRRVEARQAAEDVAVEAVHHVRGVRDGGLVVRVLQAVHQPGEEAHVLLVERAVRGQVGERLRRQVERACGSTCAALVASAMLVPSSTCTMPKKPTGLRRAIVS